MVRAPAGSEEEEGDGDDRRTLYWLLSMGTEMVAYVVAGLVVVSSLINLFV